MAVSCDVSTEIQTAGGSKRILTAMDNYKGEYRIQVPSRSFLHLQPRSDPRVFRSSSLGFSHQDQDNPLVLSLIFRCLLVFILLPNPPLPPLRSLTKLAGCKAIRNLAVSADNRAQVPCDTHVQRMSVHA